ncbi:MAG: DivIVA domain-containing protein [Vicinamibacterales bacterium]
MNISPLDLRRQQFRTAFRGFDTVEVSSFLIAVADDYEEALRQTDKLRQEVARLEAQLRTHVEQEKSLQSTLLTAQRLADDIRAGAETEAVRIVREAESRAQLIIEKAHARVEDIQRDIDGLKLKRRDAESTLESSIQALRDTLDFVREQDAHDREERVLFHRPRLLEPEPKTKTG